MASKTPDEMVWYRGSDPFVVWTRWVLLRVTLGEAPVCMYIAGVGFTERSVGFCLHVTYEQVRTCVVRSLIPGDFLLVSGFFLELKKRFGLVQSLRITYELRRKMSK